VEFRRVSQLPPYAFAEINRLKLDLRRSGEDVVDLGFGNPDLPSPDVAVEKLAEAARKPRNHRYSASRGIPNLRGAVCELYRRRFGVELDPETESIVTIGAKEGLAHLLWVLVEPGDVALVPEPSYPIHLFAPVLAGASVAQVAMGPEEDVLANLADAYERSRPRPRVVVLSFPHNPTTTTVEPSFWQAVVDFARERGVVLVHDFAYADIAFDGYRPPSILEAEGAREIAVELYSLTKGYSMPGWRVGFVVGNGAMIAALARLKSYLDYGTFQPIQIAAVVALREADDHVAAVCEAYRRRRDALCAGLERIGWAVTRPRATMFLWAPIPASHRDLGSQEFALRLLREAKVSVSPGAGFGPGGEGFVRFALVENEQRIGQAVRSIRAALPGLGSPAGDGVAAAPSRRR
jgi:alanine-synthesizing transaminase